MQIDFFVAFLWLLRFIFLSLLKNFQVLKQRLKRLCKQELSYFTIINNYSGNQVKYKDKNKEDGYECND
jgi:hypothetical protein